MAAFVFFTTAARTFFIPTNFPSRLPAYMFFLFALVAGTCIGMLTIPIGSNHLDTSYSKLTDGISLMNVQGSIALPSIICSHLRV